MKRKIIIGLLVFAGCCFLVVSVAILQVGINFLRAMDPKPEAREISKRLLYHVNHADLYRDCMFLNANVGKFRPDPKWAHPSASKPDPADPLVPALIRDLKPEWIGVEGNGFVHLEFGGGPYHYGVDAFADPAKGEGTKELVPGLWYYSEYGEVVKP